MTQAKRMTRVDPVLGELGWCGTCAEWWPFAMPYFAFHEYRAGDLAHAGNRFYVRKTSGVASRCRVHTGEVSPWRIERARDAALVMQRCATPTCMVLVPEGRTTCYGCRGATVGPLTEDRIAAMRIPLGWVA